MSERVVATLRTRERQELRATVSIFKSVTYVHLRTYVLEACGDWHPTRAGITLAAGRFDELEAAIAALRKAIDAEPVRRPDRVERFARERRPA